MASHEIATAPTLVDRLVLVRLLAPTKRGPSRADLRKSLEPLLAYRQSAAEAGAQVDEAVRTLVAAGLVQDKPYQLTEEGRRQALAFLGLEALPARTNWTALKNKYLLAHALKLSAEQRRRLGTEEVRAIVLKQQYGLATAEVPTLPAALNALAWKQLGVDSDRPFSRGAVLAQLLGLESEAKVKKLGPMLAAKASGARNGGANELALALIRRWADGELTPASSELPAAGPVSFNLAGFAEAVREAARSSPTGRWGDHKVFIAHVWRQLAGQNAFPGMGADEFKRRLAEAQHAGLVELSRADLVEVMDPDDVRASETRYLDGLATFHFVQV